MLRSDALRRIILGVAALVFVVIAAQAVLRPDHLLLGRHLDTTWPIFALELLGGVVILVVRPSR